METDTVFPVWLHGVAIASLAIAGACAVVIALDVLRRPQEMAIMALVWPLTGLFGGPLWLAAYYLWGRGDAVDPPFAAMVLKGSSHCGAGCTLGDIVAEWTAFAFPGVATWFGWHSPFHQKLFAVWIADFLLAFLFGVGFQYFTIQPMRGLSPLQGIVAALKADVLSITAWQIGMYGLMAAIQFLWFTPAYGGTAAVATPEFWFAMQLAMLAGFVTSYPINWWLIQAGLKERM